MTRRWKYYERKPRHRRPSEQAAEPESLDDIEREQAAAALRILLSRVTPVDFDMVLRQMIDDAISRPES